MAPVNDEAKKHNQNLPGMGGIYNTVNFHLYHYAGIGQRSDSELQANNPVKYIDPTGLSTCVDENSGIILSASDDRDCGVYAYPTVDGQRVEGSGLPNGLTGTPGYFASSPTGPRDIQIPGQDKNYIGKNINDYGSGFTYGDFRFTLQKEGVIGVPLPNTWEIFGDALSASAFFLNCANAGCTVAGQFAVAEGCGTAAGCCDIGATIFYFAGGCNDKAMVSLIGVGLDIVPYAAYAFKPSLQPAYNMVTKRFVNPATGRFITNASGYRNYLLGPVTGITYSIGSNIYSSKKN